MTFFYASMIIPDRLSLEMYLSIQYKNALIKCLNSAFYFLHIEVGIRIV